MRTNPESLMCVIRPAGQKRRPQWQDTSIKHPSEQSPTSTHHAGCCLPLVVAVALGRETAASREVARFAYVPQPTATPIITGNDIHHTYTRTLSACPASAIKRPDPTQWSSFLFTP
mmetsp:Transcript_34866/g.86536  ORF Transcript_34866/g.86536 Transcript_34866/m.86536 type:complete len:116 (-) Transcript_34866:535-882(-)